MKQRYALLFLFLLFLSGVWNYPNTSETEKREHPMLSIETVKAKYEAQLLHHPEVVSVGIGLGKDGEKVIIVGLTDKLPEDRALPQTLEGYAVQTQIISTPRVQ
ncbi:MAG: hypothetical protein RQ757_12435 [Pseudomonadales bacterium]|nr:hypothetical protein [Pseudomonadales bacterium]